ncbi:site-specific integrase [bacterium]|nr:site-specific integrase [bacterium]
MAQNKDISGQNEGPRRGVSSNVKSSQKYERFGETIRYLTLPELQQLFDSITDYRHKLMLRLIYELGCRVGEFVRIQLKHVNFAQGSITFPAAKTKTRQFRISHAPRGLLNEILSLLKREGRATRRLGRILKPETYLFHPPGHPNWHYSENRIRQIFQRYVRKTGLDQEYGKDSCGRSLHRLTVHGLRHAHLMAYIHHHKLPLPIVQKQVGHKTLRATSVYLRPSTEAVAEAYRLAQASADSRFGSIA